MQAAAIEARRLHARAELMRHMLATARKVKDKPRAEAVETVVREWMDAWNLRRDEWPHVAREMQSFTEAFQDYAIDASDANDRVSGPRPTRSRRRSAGTTPRSPTRWPSGRSAPTAGGSGSCPSRRICRDASRGRRSGSARGTAFLELGSAPTSVR